MNYDEILNPKYKNGQKVIFEGVEYEVMYPVSYESHNAITGERKHIGVMYRLKGYPQDVDPEKISVTPEQLIKNL